MKNLNTTLITGASEGIGRCFAEEFAKQGHDLILVARNQEKLTELASRLQIQHAIKTTTYPADLTTPGAVETLLKQIEQDGHQVDILINNAGVMCVDDFVSCDFSRLQNLLRLNIEALVEMTHAFLPALVSSGAGKIVNIASVASFIPTPKFAVYGASKAFVLSFSEALMEETKHTGVSVHCICPGFTDTKMLTAGNGLEALIPQFMKVTPESLVADAYQSIMKGEAIYIDKLHNKLLVQWAKWYPRFIVRGVSGIFSRFK